jgi:hypothetical protein
VPDSPAGLADLPEWTSGDGALDDRASESGDDVDLAYTADDDAPPPSPASHTSPPSAGQGTLPEGSLRADEALADERPGWVDAAAAESAGPDAQEDTPAEPATDTDVDAGPVPSATGDAPHFPDDASDDAAAHHEELLDTAPSAGVSADAPVVAPQVPEVEVAPLGTESDQVPPDAAAEDEPPALELTPGAADAVLDEPRGDSDVTETSVAVGGSAEVTTPSATRAPDLAERDPSDRDDESSTTQ